MMRCRWARSEQEIAYHDAVWGQPLHDEGRLFEMLLLEGQQAGLSWNTILVKWDNFAKAYDGFDPEKIALYDEAKVQELMQDAGIIRNKSKIGAAIGNARAYLALRQSGETLDHWLWEHVQHEPIINHFAVLDSVPASTALSELISKKLKKLGFKFVGPTIIYAYMQSIGMVCDHTTDCFLHPHLHKIT